MSVLNRLLRVAFDGLLYPFRELHPMVGLTLVSLATGVGMLLIFKYTSNQTKLAEVKRRIHAGLFEIRLFNDDLRAILRAQAEILGHNMNYLRLSLVPLVFILPPLVLVMVQLQYHYGYRGLEPGAPVLLEAELEEGWEALSGGVAATPTGRPRLELEVPEGLRLDSPAVWVPSRQEVSWRLVAEEPGRYELRIRLGEETLAKTVIASDAVVRRAPARLERGFLNQLIHPAEAPIPGDSLFAAVRVDYPERDVGLGALEGHWIIAFFILSIVFAFALRNRLGVTI